MSTTKHLVKMLKTLGDESRLEILRILNEAEHTAGDVAQRVELSESTVSHHLGRLRKAGLITLRMAGNQRFYRVNSPILDGFKQDIQTIEQVSPEDEAADDDMRWIEDLDWREDDKKVLRDNTEFGRLLRFPAKRKKQLVILRWVATLFEADRYYSEKEVNEVISTVYADDFVTLRRDLVDMGYLRRERGGGRYWLTPEDEA